MRKTNFDKIKEMSVEEMSEFLVRVYTTYTDCRNEGRCKWEDYPTHDKGCKDCFKEWLEREVEK